MCLIWYPLQLSHNHADDGPGENTPAVLNHLATQKITATFFVIGANAIKSDAFRKNLKAVDTAGHQIALHSWYLFISSLVAIYMNG